MITKTAKSIRKSLVRFLREDDGTASLEFVLVFPVFFTMFLMTVESGLVNARHVMLERGVDLTVREIRIGRMAVPNADRVAERICEIALIIPDCAKNLRVELLRRNPVSFDPVTTGITCIDRSQESQPVLGFTPGTNNDLMVMRVCVRIDPLLPTTGLGKAIVDGRDEKADGSYALVTQSAFVVEPFQ